MLWISACWMRAAQAELPPFQPLVDAADEGAVLTPKPGTYAGPVVVDKPITIDGGGKGTVVLLATDGATLKGLRLTNSGDSHNHIDAGVGQAKALEGGPVGGEQDDRALAAAVDGDRLVHHHRSRIGPRLGCQHGTLVCRVNQRLERRESRLRGLHPAGANP